MPEVRILDRTTVVDRSDPKKPVEKIIVTFMSPEGRIGMVSIPKAEYSAVREKEEIKKEYERLVARAGEKVVF